ncbi:MULTISPECIES: hypothetical protein [Bacillus]|uniref:hypothetical protein n=1 Tax=Bacillus TaxID=1386 RepID=UPI001F5813D3|nr:MULTISPECIES: hypothetical protein [Bacillus cereus group]USL16769.1 hypothetical protein LIT28_29875 [Bacillus thuringiensis]
MNKYILPGIILISIITFIANFIVNDEKINALIDVIGLILILGFWGFSRMSKDQKKNK